MTNEVTQLIAALRDGSMSLKEVVLRFHELDWQSAKPPPEEDDPETATSEGQAPEPAPSVSFDDVTAAYARGELKPGEYRLISEAVAMAKWKKSRAEQ